jgi:hypothetical protein
MKKTNFLLIGFSILLLTSFKSDNLPKEFSDLLDRAKMTFVKPIDYFKTPAIINNQMNYEYALVYSGKTFEVRYAIRPLDEQIKEYEKNMKNKKDGDIFLNPNNIYETVLQATVLNISGGILPNITAFNKDAVKNEFNADWGATAFVEVGKEFGQAYKYCMVVAIHKDNVADAYYFYLSDSKEGFNEMMQPAFHSLKFK